MPDASGVLVLSSSASLHHSLLPSVCTYSVSDVYASAADRAGVDRAELLRECRRTAAATKDSSPVDRADFDGLIADDSAVPQSVSASAFLSARLSRAAIADNENGKRLSRQIQSKVETFKSKQANVRAESSAKLIDKEIANRSRHCCGPVVSPPNMTAADALTAAFDVAALSRDMFDGEETFVRASQRRVEPLRLRATDTKELTDALTAAATDVAAVSADRSYVAVHFGALIDAAAITETAANATKKTTDAAATANGGGSGGGAKKKAKKK